MFFFEKKLIMSNLSISRAVQCSKACSVVSGASNSWQLGSCCGLCPASIGSQSIMASPQSKEDSCYCSGSMEVPLEKARLLSVLDVTSDAMESSSWKLKPFVQHKENCTVQIPLERLPGDRTICTDPRVQQVQPSDVKVLVQPSDLRVLVQPSDPILFSFVI
jgi:hypothetical protein